MGPTPMALGQLVWDAIHGASTASMSPGHDFNRACVAGCGFVQCHSAAVYWWCHDTMKNKQFRQAY
jgi:hypothetical protein